MMLKYRQWDRSLCRHHYCRDRSTYNRYKTLQESQNLIIKSSSFSLIWFFLYFITSIVYLFPLFRFFSLIPNEDKLTTSFDKCIFFCKCISYFIYKSYLFCLMLRYDMMFVYGIFPSLFTYWLSLWSLHF